MRRPLALLAATLLAGLAAAAPAGAARDQESVFQDDAMLVYPPIATVSRTLDTLQELGVDRIRVSVYWRLVAPSPTADHKPSFAAGDPAAYAKENWRRYDDLVRAAYERGIQVNFDVQGPAPRWASQPAPPSNVDLDGAYQPDPGEFAQFAHAVGARYTGSYVPPADNQNPPPPPPKNPNPLPVPIPPGASSASARAAQAPSDALPRVNYWSFWNEPNQKIFLSPQYVNGREWSPQLYRAFVDGGWQALADTGHGGDTVIVGDTAPKGGGERDPLANMRPLRFVRALYCVDGGLRPLRGSAAQALGCPTANQVATFPFQHPGLFAASGFAHHPYALLTPPGLPARNADDVAVADIPRLDRTLRRIFGAYRQRNRLPIYNTEFGYQTRPPDPFGFRPALAAAYINQAEYMGYVNPDLRSYDQFLLQDAPPTPGVAPGDPAYWSSFQTGLEFGDGTPKPQWAAYRVPIFIPNGSRTFPGTFRIWGAVRPAPNGSAQTVEVIYRPLASRRWRVVKRVVTRSLRNYVDTRVRLPLSGLVRLRWRNPATGVVELSRTASVYIRF
ncbi:MAG: hypothetical protein M3155_06520 [Actinomycetota bacterium]|nr:hypothetical protein [Actinomycetota bacterium]